MGATNEINKDFKLSVTEDQGGSEIMHGSEITQEYKEETDAEIEHQRNEYNFTTEYSEEQCKNEECLSAEQLKQISTIIPKHQPELEPEPAMDRVGMKQSKPTTKMQTHNEIYQEVGVQRYITEMQSQDSEKQMELDFSIKPDILKEDIEQKQPVH